MIASVAFKSFKALRSTNVALTPFNLVIGPNGSGKTSLIESILRLSAAARATDVPGAPEPHAAAATAAKRAGPQMEFHFNPPHDALAARLIGETETGPDTLEVTPRDATRWAPLRAALAGIRGYVLDHTALAQPARLTTAEAALSPDGNNLAAVLAALRLRAPDSFSQLTAEMLRVAPEFRSLELTERADGSVELGLRLTDDGVVAAAELSQGMLYLLGLLALAFDPSPPAVLCIEEVDRGIHPRTLREVRDALYRLSYPDAFGMARAPVQVIATTHSPYLIDLFREHPEEVVISQKHGRAAHFERLADRPDLPELLREGSLGDMWFSGILGGVPDQE